LSFAPSLPKVVAVIPARGGSKRLPKKNLHPVCGRPMLAWVVEAALNSGVIAPENLLVSSDDPSILSFAQELGVVPINRPSDLSGDEVWTEPVIRHAVEHWERTAGSSAEIIVWLNASIPEVTSEHIARVVARLVEGGFREVLTVDPTGILTSAARAMIRDALDQRALTAASATVYGDFLDVHTLDDVARVERRLASATGRVD